MYFWRVIRNILKSVGQSAVHFRAGDVRAHRPRLVSRATIFISASAHNFCTKIVRLATKNLPDLGVGKKL
jgi:hypothetical protein